MVRHSGHLRKQQILDTATALFGRYGYDRVTVKKVAAACGITEPAVYRHYASKEQLYEAVLAVLPLRLHLTKLFKDLQQESDCERLLSGLATHIISFFSKNDEVYRLLLYAALSGHEQAAQVYSSIRGAYIKFLADRLKQLAAQRIILKTNYLITARCFIGMVFECALSVTLWRGMYGRVFRPEDIVANNVPIYARGLRPEEHHLRSQSRQRKLNR